MLVPIREVVNKHFSNSAIFTTHFSMAHLPSKLMLIATVSGGDPLSPAKLVQGICQFLQALHQFHTINIWK